MSSAKIKQFGLDGSAVSLADCIAHSDCASRNTKAVRLGKSWFAPYEKWCALTAVVVNSRSLSLPRSVNAFTEKEAQAVVFLFGTASCYR